MRKCGDSMIIIGEDYDNYKNMCEKDTKKRILY